MAAKEQVDALKAENGRLSKHVGDLERQIERWQVCNACTRLLPAMAAAVPMLTDCSRAIYPTQFLTADRSCSGCYPIFKLLCCTLYCKCDLDNCWMLVSVAGRCAAASWRGPARRCRRSTQRWRHGLPPN